MNTIQAGANEHKSSKIWIGTSGWSYPDWEGIVYPAKMPRGSKRLSFLADYVDAVEVNSTFYQPPRAAFCLRWLDEVDHHPDFMFTAKLWQRFTHDKDSKWAKSDVNVYRDGITPLAEAGKLGAILVQFPWSFKFEESSRDRLKRIAEDFSPLPLIVELRHASWLDDRALKFISDGGLGFCNIDQPTTRSSIGPTNVLIGGVAYYRFHGRNREKWFAKDAGRDQRYDYLYTAEEMNPWLERILEAAGKAERVFVMTNNHYRGKCVVNALQMRAYLKQAKVTVPPDLISHYPELKDIADGTSANELFA